MSLTFSPDPIPSAVRGQEFSEIITVSVTDSTGILNISGQLLGDIENIDLIYTSGSSFTLTGKYMTGWTDIFTFVEKDQSDLTADPQTAVGISNMPLNKNLYNLNQDQKQSIVRTWTITVTYSDLLGDPQEINANLTQEVFNDLDAMKDFMGGYYT